MLSTSTLVRAISCFAAAALSFSSSATAQAPHNICASAPLIGTGTFVGTTIGSTPDGPNECFSGVAPDVWYKFTNGPEDISLILDTCGSAYDTVLAVHSACPATGANALGCNDDRPSGTLTSCPSTISYLSVGVAADQTVYIRITGYGGNSGAFTLHVSTGAPPAPCTVGPDVVVGAIYDMAYFGVQGGIAAYAVGTDAFNKGCLPVMWISNTTEHPVIAQNLYRLKNGRFEQLGQSWLKHGFASTNGDDFGTCIDPPLGGAQLGVNCSDIYWASLNGNQSYLGPRSHVNATAGTFPYPYTSPGAGYIVPPAVTTGNQTIARRLQVTPADVNPGSNPGARYFAEAHYVTADDAAAGNGLNNASYTELTASTMLNATPAIGSTVAEKCAIEAWKVIDPTITLIPVDYLEGAITARFWLAAKVTNNGNGTWHYEYALFNLNSHRSAGSFAVPVADTVTTSSHGFRAPTSHSGEPYSNTAWTDSKTNGVMKFTTQTFAVNANANALRWSTMYNFRFDATIAPATGNATIGLFRPGSVGSPDALIVAGVPIPGVPAPVACNIADIVGPAGTPPPDGRLGGEDFLSFMGAFAGGGLLADIVGPSGNPPPDGSVAGEDFLLFLAAFTGGC